MEIPDDDPPRRKGYGGPSIRYWNGMHAERRVESPKIDPARPVHIALASPWQNVVRTDRIESVDRITWDFPENVVSGDTVITVVDAREPAVVGVTVLQTLSIAEPSLATVAPRVRNGMSMLAVEKRTGSPVGITPRTLDRAESDAVLAAIAAEATHPTPWYELPNPCVGDEDRDVTGDGPVWGCNSCGCGSTGQYQPRSQIHIEQSGSGHSGPGSVVVCPSCHDILHQPLGPTSDELMFSNRPACPKCHERKTFKQISGLPVEPPPYGTITTGCVVIAGEEPGDYRCGACDHEW